MNRFYSCLLLIALFTACKKEVVTSAGTNNPFGTNASQSAVTAGNTAIVQHNASPQTTDKQITTKTIGNPVQIAFLPKSALLRKPKLFVFLPGTFSTPSAYQQVLKVAARNGYFAFGIAYDNRSTVEAKAGNTNNDKVTENIFEEYLTGNDVSGKVNIPRANSFENRIIKMIEYLGKTYPSENWLQFLTTSEQLDWKKISIAGHSQGADHTMYMSKKRNLLRAGFFSGPYNFKLTNGSYPSFIQNPGITPVAQVFGFCHVKDNVRVYSDVAANWEELQLPGVPASVDGISVFTSNRLTTNIAGNLNTYHGSTVSDDATPLDAKGNPAFADVWAYMCFP